MALAVEILVFGTVGASVLCWGVAEAARHRGLWAAGALLMLVHSAAAFQIFYDGSHEVARVETARQTAALTGIEFSGGIYVNYLFLLVWSADALWWLASPRTYTTRVPAVDWAIRGFIFFIIVNGAVVFADGWARLIGIVAVGVAIVGAWRRAVVRRREKRVLTPR